MHCIAIPLSGALQSISGCFRRKVLGGGCQFVATPCAIHLIAWRQGAQPDTCLTGGYSTPQARTTRIVWITAPAVRTALVADELRKSKAAATHLRGSRGRPLAKSHLN